MAPDVAGAQDVLGYDGWGDALFRAAIERATGDDRGVATLPFDLIEGGRGYVFLRAFDIDRPGPRTNAATGATAAPGAHIVSLLVRADRLIEGEGMPEGTRVELRQRDEPGRERGMIAAASGKPSLSSPATALRRAVPSTQQPFEFCLDPLHLQCRKPRSTIWAPASRTS